MQNLLPNSFDFDSKHFVRRSLVWLALAIVSACSVPQSLAQAPVGQQPVDQAAQVSAAINQRVDAGDFDAAAALAERHFDAIELGDDEAAKRAIVLSKLRVEVLLRTPMSQQPTLVAAAAEPLDRILNAYPDHRFAAWLRFQRLALDTAVARRRGLAILAAPGDDAERLSALASLIKTAGGMRDLQNEVAESIAKAFAQREQPARIDHLMSLRNAIATERVGVLLARGELFPSESDDFLAAATEANQAAIEALAMVRDDSAVQSDLVTMRCEALLRMGQPDDAARVLVPLLAASAESAKERLPPSDATRAMAVRIAIQRQQLSDAQQWLDSHYGDQPHKAPTSPLSDLARLRFLIASGSPLTDHWIKSIGTRGGDYLVRRAQMIASELLGPDAVQAANGDLVIAEAGLLMRKGDATAAANLLETYLQKTEDAQSALKVATRAAAILTGVKRQSDAAELLAKTATRFDAHQGSAELMLQAAMLHDEQANAPQTDQILRDLMNRWPTNPNAMLARDWLVDRTEKTATTLAAAIVATPDPATDSAVVAALAAWQDPPEQQRFDVFYNATWQRAETLWIRVFAEIDPFDHSLQLSQAFRDARAQATQSLGQSQSPAARRCRKTIATLFQDTQQLNDASFRDSPIDDKPLIQWLYAIRIGGAIVVPPASHDNDLSAAAGMALMIDGRKLPAMRVTLSNAMIALLANVPGTELAHCQALVWNGNWKLAPKLLDHWIAARPSGEKTEIAAMQAAKLISQANDPAAPSIALDRYLKLSKDVSTRSPRWHSIKLATIESMITAGKPDEAKQLAQYILITRPPIDLETNARYETLSQ